MPAAAVIPAPKAYIQVVAVKKLVVAFPNGIFEFTLKGRRNLSFQSLTIRFFLCLSKEDREKGTSLSKKGSSFGYFQFFGKLTLSKKECSKQASLEFSNGFQGTPCILTAWDHKISPQKIRKNAPRETNRVTQLRAALQENKENLTFPSFVFG